jgi:uncharacterized protein (TIGR02466 family)|tara:strand:- start:2579 stop:3193 length:615 start_codon:yes stop_codon:yes gene_type:complete
MSLEFISNEHMLFPTPLWQVQIKGVDNDAIKKYVYNLRDTTEGVVISNRGGWHSKDILEPIPEALENLFSDFQSFVNQYCAQITGLNQLKIGNFWFNINSKYDYNRTHDHQNSILSAVYYIDAEGDNIGSFVAERDDSAEFFLGTYKNISPFTSTSFSIIPLTGFAFIMPSWVLHSVEQNFEDRDRISLAVNFIRHDIEENPYV